jgi:hypothetical protein
MPTYKQQEPQPPPLTPGKHRVEIEGAELKISDRTNNEYIRIKCRVKSPDGTNGGTIYDNMVFTAKSDWKIDQIREALGFAIVPNEDANVEPEHLLGRTGTVFVEFNEESGYHEISRWVAPKDAATASAPVRKTTTIEEQDDIPW